MVGSRGLGSLPSSLESGELGAQKVQSAGVMLPSFIKLSRGFFLKQGH